MNQEEFLWLQAANQPEETHDKSFSIDKRIRHDFPPTAIFCTGNTDLRLRAHSGYGYPLPGIGSAG